MDLNRRLTSGHESLMGAKAESSPRLPEHVPALNELMADMLVVEHKCRAFRWTVKGPRFFELHDKFQALYRSASVDIDDVAMRIAALGGRPLLTLESALGTAVLPEAREPLAAQRMIESLAVDFTSLLGTLRAVGAQAEVVGDTATFNLLGDQADELEKSLWMLRAWLG